PRCCRRRWIITVVPTPPLRTPAGLQPRRVQKPLACTTSCQAMLLLKYGRRQLILSRDDSSSHKTSTRFLLNGVNNMTKQLTTSPDVSGTGASSYHASPKELRRIQFSSFLGTAIEYYDFILYATAAGIVFNRVFFVGLDQHVALILSFATLAAGYAARPLGGLIFGHLGDRLGRKTI